MKTFIATDSLSHIDSSRFMNQIFYPQKNWFGEHQELQSSDYFIENNQKFLYVINTLGDYHNWLDSEGKGLFNIIPKKILNWANKGNVLFYINTCYEGFGLTRSDNNKNKTWAQLFHEKIKEVDIDPFLVIFHTGNLIEAEKYNEWANKNGIDKKIHIVSQCAFAAVSGSDDHYYSNFNSISFTEHINFKKNNNVKLFSCLNRRTRSHRSAIVAMLNFYGLLDNSETSFNLEEDRIENPLDYFENKHPAFSKKYFVKLSKAFPLVLDSSDFEVNWATNILRETYLNTYFSLITETFFQEEIESVFLSEKIFKPVLARHPFIVVGQPYTLKYFKSLGFKTFDKWFDESYDEEYDPIRRIEKICLFLKSLSLRTKEDWIKMYNEMKPILEYNYTLLKTKDFAPNTEFLNIYKDFLK